MPRNHATVSKIQQVEVHLLVHKTRFFSLNENKAQLAHFQTSRDENENENFYSFLFFARQA